jgi:hypothetical protein
MQDAVGEPHLSKCTSLTEQLLDDPEFHFDISYLDFSVQADIATGLDPSYDNLTLSFSVTLPFPGDPTEYSPPYATNLANDATEDMLGEEGLDSMNGHRVSGLRGGEMISQPLHSQPTSLAYAQSPAWPYVPNPSLPTNTFDDDAAAYTSDSSTETVDEDMPDYAFDPRSIS